jgi:hypothetical protein
MLFSNPIAVLPLPLLLLLILELTALLFTSTIIFCPFLCLPEATIKTGQHLWYQLLIFSPFALSSILEWCNRVSILSGRILSFLMRDCGSSIVEMSISKTICLYYTKTHTAINVFTYHIGISLERNIICLQHIERTLKVLGINIGLYGDRKTIIFKVQFCMYIIQNVWNSLYRVEVPELPSVQGYNWATLSLGGINTEAWPSKLGVGREADNLTL